MELVIGIDYEDAGQAAILAAEQNPDNYSFRIDFNDDPAGGTPSKRFFVAKIMSARESLDTANNVVKLNATLGINSNIAKTSAAGP